MYCSKDIGKIAPALLKAQRKMKSAVKDSANPYFKSKYADLPAVIDACVEVLHEQGVFILQPVGKDSSGDYVETTLMHESGEFMSDKMYLTPQTDMQKLGSAVTYARRYGLQSMLCMKAEDDDGEAAVGRGKAATKGSAKAAEAVPSSASTLPSATATPPGSQPATETKKEGSTSSKAANSPKPSSSPSEKTDAPAAPSTDDSVLPELEELTAKLDKKKREAVLAYINKNLKNPEELARVRDRLKAEQKAAVA